MFTGIVETIGTVESITILDTSETGGGGWSLVIKDASLVLSDAILGDSISVNGVCLTITELDALKSSAKFGISPETLRKTNLGSLNVNSSVNLERAMSLGQRFSGHFVQGHVDTTVLIESITSDPPNSIIYKFKVPEPIDSDFMNYIIPKGYICLDGTSLTVIDTNTKDRTFSVMLIAYTQEKVIMSSKKVGDSVNIEVDQLAKYVEKLVLGLLDSGNGSGMLEKMLDRLLTSKLSK